MDKGIAAKKKAGGLVGDWSKESARRIRSRKEQIDEEEGRWVIGQRKRKKKCFEEFVRTGLEGEEEMSWVIET